MQSLEGSVVVVNVVKICCMHEGNSQRINIFFKGGMISNFSFSIQGAGRSLLPSKIISGIK